MHSKKDRFLFLIENQGPDCRISCNYGDFCFLIIIPTSRLNIWKKVASDFKCGSAPIVHARMKQSVFKYFYLEEVDRIRQWEHFCKHPYKTNSAKNGFVCFYVYIIPLMFHVVCVVLCALAMMTPVHNNIKKLGYAFNVLADWFISLARAL